MKNLELNAGARVYCRDGKCGRLAALVVGANGRHVSHIVVEQGFLQKRYAVLPISLVAQATTGDVYLAMDDADMGHYPTYQSGAAAAALANREAGSVAQMLAI